MGLIQEAKLNYEPLAAKLRELGQGERVKYFEDYYKRIGGGLWKEVTYVRLSALYMELTRERYEPVLEKEKVVKG